FGRHVLGAAETRAAIALAGIRLGIVSVIGIGILRLFGAAGVDLALVEPRAFRLVADDFVGGADFLEPRLGLFVTGIEVGVELLGELAVDRTDFRVGRVRLDPQHLVRIARSHALHRHARDTRALDPEPACRVEILARGTGLSEPTLAVIAAAEAFDLGRRGEINNGLRTLLHLDRAEHRNTDADAWDQTVAAAEPCRDETRMKAIGGDAAAGEPPREFTREQDIG